MHGMGAGNEGDSAAQRRIFGALLSCGGSRQGPAAYREMQLQRLDAGTKERRRFTLQARE